MDLGIRGKLAAVSAGSAGMGLATARVLVSEGASVAIGGRNAERLARAAEQLRAAAEGEVVAVEADLSREGGPESFLERAIDGLGGLDILVANSGGPPAGSFESVEDPDWLRGVDVTLLSVVRLVRDAVPEMRRRGAGRIVVITSFAAKQPSEGLVVSSTLRMGILGLVKVLAREFARDRITVNAVCPGWVSTNSFLHVLEEQARREGRDPAEVRGDLERDIPMGRLATPEEVANVIAFLCSRPASYVTGVAVGIDGGLVRSPS